MAEYVELYLDQGTDFNLTVNLTDDATNQSDNIAGYIVTSSLRRSLLSKNASANMVCTLTDSSNGEFTIFMDAANTANLKEGRYFFDVRVNNSNTISRLMEGIIIVVPSITR